MRRPTFDLFPAEAWTSDGTHYTRVRVLAADDGTAWIIAMTGEVFVEDTSGVTEIVHDAQQTTLVGPGWTIARGGGCGCNGEKSRVRARELLNQ